MPTRTPIFNGVLQSDLDANNKAMHDLQSVRVGAASQLPLTYNYRLVTSPDAVIVGSEDAFAEVQDYLHPARYTQVFTNGDAVTPVQPIADWGNPYREAAGHLYEIRVGPASQNEVNAIVARVQQNYSPNPYPVGGISIPTLVGGSFGVFANAPAANRPIFALNLSVGWTRGNSPGNMVGIETDLAPLLNAAGTFPGVNDNYTAYWAQAADKRSTAAFFASGTPSGSWCWGLLAHADFKNWSVQGSNSLNATAAGGLAIDIARSNADAYIALFQAPLVEFSVNGIGEVLNRKTAYLSSALGASSVFETLYQLVDGNGSQLLTKARRHTAAAGWPNVGWSISHVVDASEMGFLQFNPPGYQSAVALGTATIPSVIFDGDGTSGNMRLLVADSAGVLRRVSVAPVGSGGTGYSTLRIPNGSSLAIETWIAPALANSWVNYGTGFQTAGYRLDTQGRVWLRGLIRGGSIAPGSVIMTLPPGYRPTAYEHFGIGTDAFGSIFIDANGAVHCNVVPSNASLSLAGISFSTN